MRRRTPRDYEVTGNMAKKTEKEPIEFNAQVIKVASMADNGIRLTLDLPETATLQMALLHEIMRAGVVLSIKAAPIMGGSAEIEQDKDLEQWINRAFNG